MSYGSSLPLVSTIRERCRVCYTCVRECPAKAIRICNGQAEVLNERCIGCGNCVRVCSQKAKKVFDSIGQVKELLASGNPVAAIVAPSFPAQFADLDSSTVVGMIRALGFGLVCEVAFGADLVADRYRRRLEPNDSSRWIATSCPAVVGYISRYHPNLTSRLMPIVSPMVASARVVKARYGSQWRIVFIGPCIAKKAEAACEFDPVEVDAVLTFIEANLLLCSQGIVPEKVEPTPFDPPLGGAGALFPIARGMLQASCLQEDLILGTVVAADGRTDFVEAIKEFESGDLDARLLEVLCCDGCIMGPGIDSDIPLFRRRSRVSRYVRRKMTELDQRQWKTDMESFAGLDLTRTFAINDQRIPVPEERQIEEILHRMGKFSLQDELNCGACGYDTCREHAIAIYRGLAENEMCLPYTIDRLRRTVQDLADSHQELTNVQEALVQSEKLASMGQLAAGIAHEVNNPLGVVLMYSHLLLEQFQDNPKMKDDLETIVEHTDRCKKIVSGLLNFARQNKVIRRPTHLCALVDRCLASHPLPDPIRLAIDHGSADLTVDLDKDQISQVLTNLIANAVDAMPDGGDLTVRTHGDDGWAVIEVRDTGVGISAEHQTKIFEPFFTTKQMGKGTGLGLAVSYGIVKMHHGDIHVTSNADPNQKPTGTTFRVRLPRSAPEA